MIRTLKTRLFSINLRLSKCPDLKVFIGETKQSKLLPFLPTATKRAKGLFNVIQFTPIRIEIF